MGGGGSLEPAESSALFSGRRRRRALGVGRTCCKSAAAAVVVAAVVAVVVVVAPAIALRHCTCRRADTRRPEHRRQPCRVGSPRAVPLASGVPPPCGRAHWIAHCFPPITSASVSREAFPPALSSVHAPSRYPAPLVGPPLCARCPCGGGRAKGLGRPMGADPLRGRRKEGSPPPLASRPHVRGCPIPQRRERTECVPGDAARRPRPRREPPPSLQRTGAEATLGDSLFSW